VGVGVSTEGPIAFGARRSLPLYGLLMFRNYRDYDFARDGRLVALIPSDVTSSGEPARPQIHVVENWFDALMAGMALP
jgi:hypothetical protein